jgi:hypothetical protein
MLVRIRDSITGSDVFVNSANVAFVLGGQTRDTGVEDKENTKIIHKPVPYADIVMLGAHPDLNNLTVRIKGITHEEVASIILDDLKETYARMAGTFKEEEKIFDIK